jgi:hypothetical protein
MVVHHGHSEFGLIAIGHGVMFNVEGKELAGSWRSRLLASPA